MKTSLFIYALLQGLLVAFSYDIEEIVQRGGQRGSSYYDWPTDNNIQEMKKSLFVVRGEGKTNMYYMELMNKGMN